MITEIKTSLLIKPIQHTRFSSVNIVLTPEVTFLEVHNSIILHTDLLNNLEVALIGAFCLNLGSGHW